MANSAVRLQVGPDQFAATARTVMGEERAKLWSMMAEIFPSYNDYQAKAQATREVPLVMLEPN